MPQAVERCVSSLLSKWKKDPKSRPKPQKDGQDAKGQAFAICNAAQKAEAVITSVMLEGTGPVVAGIAATNRPFLPLPPITIVEENGKELVRVPFMVQGIFKHPKYGKLAFNQETYDRIRENHKKGLIHHGVSLDPAHQPKLGALAWFDEQMGGRFAQEEQDGKKLLVAYGLLTGDEAKATISSGKYRYASVDMYPNFESDVVELLSSDDFESVTMEELLQEEGNMSKEYPVKNEDGTVLLSKDMFDEFEAAKTKLVSLDKNVKELTTTLEKANARVAELEKADDKGDDGLPAEFKVLLEQRDVKMAEMQHRLLSAEVSSLIAGAGAHKDEAGRMHSPVLLDWAEAVLQGKPIGSEDAIIKLEKGAPEKYFFESVAWLLKNVPGQVPVDGNTQGDDVRLERGATEHTKDDFKSFWGNSAEGGE